jgi:hypothetical protein
VSLLGDIDAATSGTSENFERLFDDGAGRPSPWSVRLKFRKTRSSPAQMSVELEDQLAAAAAFDTMLRVFRPMVIRRHKECESHLLRMIEQRQRIDFDIEDIQRQSDVLMLQIADRRGGVNPPGDPDDLPAPDETLRALMAGHAALRERELAFTPERETLQRLISIYVDFVEALNGHVGMVNAMARKLAVDNERRIALLKAVQAQAGGLAKPPRASVAALVDAFDAHVLSGQDLARRKLVADEAFARRLQARQPEGRARHEAAEPLVEAQPET